MMALDHAGVDMVSTRHLPRLGPLKKEVERAYDDSPSMYVVNTSYEYCT